MMIDSGARSSSLGSHSGASVSTLHSSDMQRGSMRPPGSPPAGGLSLNVHQGAGKTPKNSISSNNTPGLHSCVVRIRAEDQHLAEDIVEGLEFQRDKVLMSQLASHVNNLFLHGTSRRSNPSPLGSNARQPSPLMGMIRC